MDNNKFYDDRLNHEIRIHNSPTAFYIVILELILSIEVVLQGTIEVIVIWCHIKTV